MYNKKDIKKGEIKMVEEYMNMLGGNAEMPSRYELNLNISSVERVFSYWYRIWYEEDCTYSYERMGVFGDILCIYYTELEKRDEQLEESRSKN